MDVRWLLSSLYFNCYRVAVNISSGVAININLIYPD
jgi:hypothetical protein